MATKSFSRDIIVSSGRAIKLLKDSLTKSSNQCERRIAPKAKGSKHISDSQVQNILRDY
ncbi:MAG TPA: hypothetical protein PLR03_01770 [Sphaerochaeta sp.]|jgi:hypothetical protein|nr:hypothetical protein [Sphaerochaeta sp.]HPY45092.1 hypothetical protein [Sphaerochaeta sp.]HQB04934.1 hypothetical protein [Sphaerochaeta sp.]